MEKGQARTALRQPRILYCGLENRMPLCEGHQYGSPQVLVYCLNVPQSVLLTACQGAGKTVWRNMTKWLVRVRATALVPVRAAALQMPEQRCKRQAATASYWWGRAVHSAYVVAPALIPVVKPPAVSHGLHGWIKHVIWVRDSNNKEERKMGLTWQQGSKR